MSYDDNEFALASLDREKVKDFTITQTTDKWNTAKSVLQKIFYLLAIGVGLYLCWSFWGIYFPIGFFASMPFTFIFANKLVKVPLRWYMSIDVTNKKLSFFGVPRSWSFRGDTLPLIDNKDNNVYIINTIDLNYPRHRVTTTMKNSDMDRLAFLNDASTLDIVVDKLEEVQLYAYKLERNFYNEVIATMRKLMASVVGESLVDILRQSKAKLENSSVLKRVKKEVTESDGDE